MTDRIDVERLRARLGGGRPVGEWVVGTQGMINEFAEQISDQQWIHVDEDLAGRESPFGSTIAHGLLVLSLVPKLMTSTGAAWRASHVRVNYGNDRLRFIALVKADSRIRVRHALGAVES